MDQDPKATLTEDELEAEHERKLERLKDGFAWAVVIVGGGALLLKVILWAVS